VTMDDRLIEQINNKDPKAFHQLYDKYYKALVYYAMQQIESLEASEDIVQDLFISIWEKDLHFANGAAFNVYLYNSIRNSVINYFRHREIENNYQKQQRDAEAEENDEDIDFIFDDEVYKQLFRLIDDLPDRCREVFLMYMKGKKNKEIADALQISTETVKTHKKRAIAHLKKYFSIYSLSGFLLYLSFFD
jgi:RNA polymerase sigma-70 factor (family 1)